MKIIQLDEGISLLSGATMNYNRPWECEATIDDLATALSNVCRFAGHVPYFYSVAQHSVNVSLLVPPEHAFTALMHDTAEAFTNDIPTPLKTAIPALKDLEIEIEKAMAARFGFDFPLPPEVKQADLQTLGLEKEHIKQSPDKWACLDGVEYNHLFDKVNLEPMSPYRACALFLGRYERLKEQNEKSKDGGSRERFAA